jgi:RND family efflux transporter MFP subunit
MISTPHRNRRRFGASRRAAVAPLSVAAVLLTAGCDSEGNVYAPPPPPEVIVANPVERDVVEYVTYTGIVEASETVELRARVQGFLRTIEFAVGSKVEAGQLLFTIEPEQYEAAKATASGRVAEAEAALALAEVGLAKAQSAFDKEAVTELELKQYQAERLEAQGAVESARANLSAAELDLSYTRIAAPIAGRVTENLVDRGNLVGRAEPTLLATIVQATPAYVSVDISEADILRIRNEVGDRPEGTRRGQTAPGEWRPCQVALSDDPAFDIEGHVDYVSPEIDPDTGTLRLRTVYENADEQLVPGLFTRVRFPISSTPSMLVPDAALVSDQRGRYAMVVNDQNEVEVRRVEVGMLDGTMRVVESGLEPDDRVIVLGVLKARPGSKVTPKTESESQAGG